LYLSLRTVFYDDAGHAHSPVPEQWPQLSHILQYRDRVRQRIAQLYAQYSSSSDTASTPAAAAAAAAESAAVAAMPADVQHVLWLCYEHEAMHLETLLYMMVQYEGTRPPPAGMLTQQGPAAAAAAAAAAAGKGNSCSSSTSNAAVGDTRRSAVAEGAETAAAVGEGNSYRDSSSTRITAVGDTRSSAVAEDEETAAESFTASLMLPPAAHMVLLPGGEVTLGFNAEGWQQQQQQQQQAPTATAPCANVPTAAAAAAAAAQEQQQHQPLRFGWDNEMPARIHSVASCEMQHRPVCVLEYLWFLAHKLSIAAAAAAAGDAGDDQHIAASYAGNSSTDAVNSSLLLSSSSSSCWVVEQFGPEGALQGLLPQSLQLTTASGAVDGTSDDISSSSSSSDALQQQMFVMLQRLLSVKSVYGPVPISTAGLWPIYCSALQAEEYAAWWDGGSCRLPTEGELLLARQYNAHVAWQYSSSSSSGGGSVSGTSNAAAELAAVDFNVWHPVNVQLLPPSFDNQQSQQVPQPNIRRSSNAAADTLKVPLISQLTDNGWEWSSTVFESHADFQPHPLYPEYSADFFDGKHLVLLGASWATIGGIAGRGSFRNWYQAGQQHVFAKFRLCRSV
jgi:formylglycine-generating enzyme required for sulfatase activity